jgi:hypothetical protein
VKREQLQLECLIKLRRNLCTKPHYVKGRRGEKARDLADQTLGAEQLLPPVGSARCAMPRSLDISYPLSVNPEGIGSFSPGLRASRYPGGEDRESTTLQGLNLSPKGLRFNPCRVVRI